jgi:FtsH-binding integral membrane protein
MATPPTAARASWRERPTVQLLATLVSVTFVLAGIIGFIPGLTTNLYDGLEFAGEDGNAEILGLFETSVLHNLVHLTFGLVGLALARTYSGARTYLIWGGVIYIALWAIGLFGGLDWIPVNDADDWLHIVLGVAMIGLGFLSTRGTAGERSAV